MYRWCAASIGDSCEALDTTSALQPVLRDLSYYRVRFSSYVQPLVNYPLDASLARAVIPDNAGPMSACAADAKVQASKHPALEKTDGFSLPENFSSFIVKPFYPGSGSHLALAALGVLLLPP